jgi:hypothetical protein
MGGFQCDISVPVRHRYAERYGLGPPVVLVECMAMDAHVNVVAPFGFFRLACIAGLVKSRSWREEYSFQ